MWTHGRDADLEGKRKEKLVRMAGKKEAVFVATYIPAWTLSRDAEIEAEHEAEGDPPVVCRDMEAEMDPKCFVSIDLV